jgi:hypothetical protein
MSLIVKTLLKDIATNLRFFSFFFESFSFSLLFQMHDFLPLLVAPTIQIRDKLPRLNFGIFGSIKLSFQIGPATSGAASPEEVTGSSPLPPSGGAIEPTVSFLWKSPLQRLSMFKPVMVRLNSPQTPKQNGSFSLEQLQCNLTQNKTFKESAIEQIHFVSGVCGKKNL